MTILVKMKSGVEGQKNGQEIEFDPYIFGADTMQYGFVWGFLPWRNLFYKIMFDFIISVKSTNYKFDVQYDAIYLYAFEEEHYYSVKKMYEPEVRVYAHSVEVRAIE